MKQILKISHAPSGKWVGWFYDAETGLELGAIEGAFDTPLNAGKYAMEHMGLLPGRDQIEIKGEGNWLAEWATGAALASIRMSNDVPR